MKKLALVAAGFAAVPMLAMTAPVFADSPGQLMGGSALYEVKNVTKSGSYAATTSASCSETVQYSIEIHNTEYGKLSNVTVKATLPTTSATSNTSTVSASATNSANSSVSVSGKVAVSLSETATMSYISGSTKLYDGNGTLVKTLADGVTTSGTNLGDLAGSTGEFVNFQAKVTCPVVTPVQIQVCNLSTKEIVTINESDFTSTKYSKDLTQCAETPTTTTTTTTTPTTSTPTVLPNTGAGNVIGIFAATVVAGAVASRLFLSRKLARKA